MENSENNIKVLRTTEALVDLNTANCLSRPNHTVTSEKIRQGTVTMRISENMFNTVGVQMLGDCNSLYSTTTIKYASLQDAAQQEKSFDHFGGILRGHLNKLFHNTAAKKVTLGGPPGNPDGEPINLSLYDSLWPQLVGKSKILEISWSVKNYTKPK